MKSKTGNSYPFGRKFLNCVEGSALGVCALQELFGSDLWSKMVPVLPHPGVEEGGIS